MAQVDVEIDDPAVVSALAAAGFVTLTAGDIRYAIKGEGVSLIRYDEIGDQWPARPHAGAPTVWWVCEDPTVSTPPGDVETIDIVSYSLPEPVGASTWWVVDTATPVTRPDTGGGVVLWVDDDTNAIDGDFRIV